MNTTFKNKLHIFIFPAAFTYFEILLRLFNKTNVLTHIFYPMIFSISVGLFFSCITSAFRRKVNQSLTLLLLFFTGLFFMIECMVKSSFQVYMPFHAITTGAAGVMGGFSSELIRAVFHGIPVIVSFFLPAALYIIYGWKNFPAHQQQLSSIRTLFLYSLILFCIGSFSASIGNSKGAYKTQFEFDTATEYFGLLTGLRLNGQYKIAENFTENTFYNEMPAQDPAVETTGNPEPEQELPGENMVDLKLDERIKTASDESLIQMHTYINSLLPSKQNEYTGLFKGKNLIMICAEAFSDVVIHPQLTPTLYRLAHNGFYFSDYYQPTWGGSTSTGEYSFLVGLAPRNGVDTMMDIKENNEYYTMGSQLQRLGYTSLSYHNGESDFYSRDITHTNLGYERFLALGNGLEDLTGWWPRDSKMFDLTMDTYIKKQPFNIYYMTLSGHCTYTKDNDKTAENLDTVLNVLGNQYKDKTNYYLCYQLELEHALTLMIEKLESAGIADDTVICLTSDHYPYGLEKSATFDNSEDYVTDLYGYEYTNAWEKDHNSLIIWSGCLENEKKEMACEISTPTYSLDIVPTLSNLFGLEYDSRLLVGRDVFSDAEPLVLWNNHSWLTTEGKYNAADNTFYPSKNSKADDAYIDRIKSIVSNKLNYSEQVVKTNYFEVLFGEK